MDRYGRDVLAGDWRSGRHPKPVDMPLSLGLIVEVGVDGFCGEVVGWENGLVVLEDRHAKRRSFPIDAPGYLVEGQLVRLRIPWREGSSKPGHTASGSRAGRPERARVALGSRIFVEGRHDAELVEQIWGEDLRHVGVVVEFMGGMDGLAGIVDDFRPEPGRRLGVLIDHLVAGTKESRAAAEVSRLGYGDYVLIAGHPYIDVWQAIRPATLGLPAWPEVPRDVDFKKGTLAALGWAGGKTITDIGQADIAHAWQKMLAKVRSYRDLESSFNHVVELLIDFVTQDHSVELEL